MCLNPTLLINKKYTITKKNGGHVPPLPDDRVKYVPVGCQVCIECRKQKANAWRIRMIEEFKHDNKCTFVRLSFNDESIEKIEQTLKESNKIHDANAVATYAVRHYLENIRSKQRKSVKHWFVTELGQTSTERIHIHGIIWHKDINLIKSKWLYGHAWIGKYCNIKSMNYMTKYMLKTDEKHKEFIPKVLCSKGIGKAYLQTHSARQNYFKWEDTNETYRLNNGYKIGLPTYYRNHIYSEEEKENLWLLKLDKEERWVMGNKIDVSTNKGMEQYEKARQWHSKRDERNGNLQHKYKFKRERKKYNAKLKNIKRLTDIKKNLT